MTRREHERLDGGTRERIINSLVPFVQRELTDSNYKLTAPVIKNFILWKHAVRKETKQCLRYKELALEKFQFDSEFNGFSEDEPIKFDDPQDILHAKMMIPLDVVREIRQATFWFNKSVAYNFGFKNVKLNWSSLPTFRWAKYASRFILSLSPENRRIIRPIDTWVVAQMWSNRDLHKDEFGSFDDIQAWLAYAPFTLNQDGSLGDQYLNIYLEDIENKIIPSLNVGLQERMQQTFDQTFDSKKIRPKKFFEWFDSDIYSMVAMNRVSAFEDSLNQDYKYLLPSQQLMLFNDLRKVITEIPEPQNILEFFNKGEISNDY